MSEEDEGTASDEFVGCFVVRNVVCDYYLTEPNVAWDACEGEPSGARPRAVPVIRVFGSTRSGRRCCLHVHGVLPYFVVPCPVARPSADFLRRLGGAVDRALLVAARRGAPLAADADACFVHRIRPFVATPFYGYHEASALFLKISLFNPALLKRAAEILQEGAVMGTVFQAHELHLPYILKFFIDNDLYGMDLLKCKSVVQRSGARECFDDIADFHYESCADGNRADEAGLQPGDAAASGLERVSACHFEADCLASDLLRPPRGRIDSLRNPGLRFIWRDERARRRTRRLPTQEWMPQSPERPSLNLIFENEAHYVDKLAAVSTARRNAKQERRADGLLDETLVDTDRIDEAAVLDVTQREASDATRPGLLGVLEDLYVETESSESQWEAQPVESAAAGRHASAEPDPADNVDELEMSQRVDVWMDDFDNDDDDERAEELTVAQVDGPTRSPPPFESVTVVEPIPSETQASRPVAPIVSFAAGEWLTPALSPPSAVDVWRDSCGEVLDLSAHGKNANRRRRSNSLSLLLDRRLLTSTRPPASTSGGSAPINESSADERLLTTCDDQLGHRLSQQTPPVALKRSTKRRHSQLDAATPENSFGFRNVTVNLHLADVLHEAYNVTSMSAEVHVNTRADLQPDPDYDAIELICFTLYSDARDEYFRGALLLNGAHANWQFARAKLCQRHRFWELSDMMHYVRRCDSELHLLSVFSQIVRKSDPDILMGFDVQRYSIGYILERATRLQLADYCSQLSRVPSCVYWLMGEEPGCLGCVGQSRFDTADSWWSLSELHIAGRIVLNLWRILRHEVALKSYTFESCVYHLLHRRVPHFTFRVLSDLFAGRPIERRRVFRHYAYRAETVVELLVRCDLLKRTCEMAKLYGIQFYDVLSRGSQYRVEAMLFRLTRGANMVAVSPSAAQRNRMAAPECIALTMEPESRFFTDPVLVLDFQSLYPSICIAYNYCYSTCLGKVSAMRAEGGKTCFGAVSLDVPPAELERLHADGLVHVSPAGVAFVRAAHRRGLVPVMLDEILQARIMVKQAMKDYKDDRQLRRVLDARQLALKLIANVTYGYTSANFSGRMPCVEVADSIVHKGRETLERAIRLVNWTSHWHARVVYGDTDSMFVLLAGRSKDEAFRVGAEIAAAVTLDNPKPIKLKFEKVYLPCVLQTKKRYVGYSYETADTVSPVFDAKGIETVRRDSCPAVAKILEKSLRLYFDSLGNIDTVRAYIMAQFARIVRSRVSLDEFVFAREYRGRMGYRPGAVVPSLQIARQRMLRDARSEPRTKERVPYVIVAGTPGATLISCVREPSAVVADPSLRLNTSYYINGQLVPVLNRVFGLVGQDARRWFAATARHYRGLLLRQPAAAAAAAARGAQRTLSQFFASAECACCGELTTRALCVVCQHAPVDTAATLLGRAAQQTARSAAAARFCRICTGTMTGSPVACTSIDCPVYFRRVSFGRHRTDAADAVRLIYEEF